MNRMDFSQKRPEKIFLKIEVNYFGLEIRKKMFIEHLRFLSGKALKTILKNPKLFNRPLKSLLNRSTNVYSGVWRSSINDHKIHDFVLKDLKFRIFVTISLKKFPLQIH